MLSRISIVISTRNRCDDVVVALESCLAQNYPDFEVLLYDDASTDGTVDVVRQQFPEVKLLASDTRRGYLVWRNSGFRDATGDIVISIDDDAYFTDRGTLARVAELFRIFPEAGAFALPYVEPACDSKSRCTSAVPSGAAVRSYTGCAHAIRRELALKVGGYPEFLVHQGEERHLCLRLLAAGYATLMADTSPIVHLFSPKRDRGRVDYYGYRNTLLFTWLVTPRQYVLPRLLIDSAQLMKYRFQLRTVPRRLRAISAGWFAIWKYRHHRNPVSRPTYLAFRSYPSHGPLARIPLVPPLRRRVPRFTDS
ncbi:MAG: glycosyltransferase [Candidatus Paceibacterota bacterium]